MEKTKLGVTVGLAGAGLYLMGLLNFIPAVIFAGYVLLFESNEWLKKTAVRMLTIVLLFGALGVCVDMIDHVFNVLNLMINWVSETIYISVPLSLTSLLNYALYLLKDILLLLMGIRALHMGHVKLDIVDKIVDKNM